MDSARQDPLEQIERAMLALRHRRPGPRFGPRGPFGPEGDAPEGVPGHRPPWGEGPPWGRGRGGPHGPGRALGGVARVRLLEALLNADPEQGLSVSDAAEAVGVDQPRASRLVAEGVERGLITRQPDPRDARRSVIRLTDAGRAFLEQTHHSRRESVATALEDFTDEELTTFAALFTRFTAAWTTPH